jgi:hypothetical protein
MGVGATGHSGQVAQVGLVEELSNPQCHGAPAPNTPLEPTANSVRCAPAVGGGSAPALAAMTPWSLKKGKKEKTHEPIGNLKARR